MKSGIFHADDWGMSPAINEGILRLAERGWLRSASCMTTAPFLDHRIDDLRRFAANGVEIYLHLNFTYGHPLSSCSERIFFPHKILLTRSLLRLLSRSAVTSEIAAQLERLVQTGLPVAGVNGHHHVHLLPGVSGPLQELMLAKKIERLLVVDDADHPPSRLQTRLFRRVGARHSGIQEVPCGYLTAKDLRSSANFFHKLEHGILPLLVHPALWNDFGESEMVDSLQEQRVADLKTIVEYLNA